MIRMGKRILIWLDQDQAKNLRDGTNLDVLDLDIHQGVADNAELELLVAELGVPVHVHLAHPCLNLHR